MLEVDGRMKQTLILLLIGISTIAASTRLSEDINNYEALTYDKDWLHDRHTRSRRSVYDKVISLKLSAFDRNFPLLLRPSTGTFHPDTVISINGFEQIFDPSHLFMGAVQGEPGSSVWGSIISGIFQGRIKLKNGENYYVERKENFKDNTGLLNNETVHSVIYKDDDVDVGGFYSKLRKRSAAAGGSGQCGNDMNAHWMRDVQNAAVVDEEINLRAKREFDHEEGDNPYVRKKRQNTGKTCNLYLQADPELWKYFMNQYTTPPGDLQITEEITSLFHSLVAELNSIYRGTVFKNDGVDYTNYNFRVDRVLVNKTCSSVRDHVFCQQNIDASNLLNLNSYTNHDSFCLAYVFTYRDFNGGTLGLAWVASPGTDKGGICSKFTLFAGNGGSRKKSLNTGIVTLENYGNRVPLIVSTITFAHEVGHNFGSQHDPAGQCSPDDSSGNFIMFASATTGLKSNNNKFSGCSISSIGNVLRSVSGGLNGHVNCFKDDEGQWCGNQIYEPEGGKEDCDCGYSSDQSNTCKCCVGRNADNDNVDEACKLKKIGGVTVNCDPSTGPCCDGGCNFKDNSHVCRPKTDCTMVTSCDGNSASCPNPRKEVDGKFCNGNTQVCIDGECSGSVCSKMGWTDCELDRDGNNPTLLCSLACKNFSSSKCYSSAQIGDNFPSEFKNLVDDYFGGGAIPLAAGQPCDKNKGFCDNFQKCRFVNAQGPLSRLKDFFFSPDARERIIQWVTKYWWVPVLVILGIIILMTLFIKFCAVHTPSSNPNKPKARKLSQTLTLRRRNQGGAQHRQGPPPSYQQHGMQSRPIQELPSSANQRQRQQQDPRRQQRNSADPRSQQYEMHRQNKKR